MEENTANVYYRRSTEQYVAIRFDNTYENIKEILALDASNPGYQEGVREIRYIWGCADREAKIVIATPNDDVQGIQVNIGDWIVRQPDGTYASIPDEGFNKLFFK